MEWYHVLTIIAVNLGMYFHSQRQIGEFHKEVKDFHGRLCALEEKYIHMMERFMEMK